MGMHHMQLQLVNVYRDEDKMSRTLPHQSLITKEYLPLMQHICSIWHTVSHICTVITSTGATVHAVFQCMFILETVLWMNTYAYMHTHTHTHTHQVCL